MAKIKNKISLTFQELLQSQKDLEELGKITTLPIAISFKYAKVLKQIQEELIVIDGEKHKLIKKHKLDLPENVGKKDLTEAADKEWIKFTTENSISFDFEPISLSDIKDISLSPLVMRNLIQFFKE